MSHQITTRRHAATRLQNRAGQSDPDFAQSAWYTRAHTFQIYEFCGGSDV